MTAVALSPSPRSARLGLRAPPEQEAVLRRAAEVAHKSLTDFILDSACLAAEQTLLEQRLFMVSGSQYQALMDLLDGIRAMLTHPINEVAAKFYTRFGLIASPLREQQLLLLLKDARRWAR